MLPLFPDLADRAVTWLFRMLPLGRAKSGLAACMPHPLPMSAWAAIGFDNRAGDSVLRRIFKVSGRDIRLKAKGYLCYLSGSPQKPRFAEGQVEPALRGRLALQQVLGCDGGHAETTRGQHPAAVYAASHLLRAIGHFDRGVHSDWFPLDSLRGGTIRTWPPTPSIIVRGKTLRERPTSSPWERRGGAKTWMRVLDPVSQGAVAANLRHFWRC